MKARGATVPILKANGVRLVILRRKPLMRCGESSKLQVIFEKMKSERPGLLKSSGQH
jgi:hypothetical protein